MVKVSANLSGTSITQRICAGIILYTLLTNDMPRYDMLALLHTNLRRWHFTDLQADNSCPSSAESTVPEIAGRILTHRFDNTIRKWKKLPTYYIIHLSSMTISEILSSRAACCVSVLECDWFPNIICIMTKSIVLIHQNDYCYGSVTVIVSKLYLLILAHLMFSAVPRTVTEAHSNKPHFWP